MFKKRISVAHFVIELFNQKIAKPGVLEGYLDLLLMNKEGKPNEVDICHAVEILQYLIPLMAPKSFQSYLPYCKIIIQYYKSKMLTTRANFKTEELMSIERIKKLI